MSRNRQGPKTPELPQTGYEMQLGPPPSRVGTRFTQNSAGLVGDDVSGHPITGGAMYIPHPPVVRNPRVGASRAGTKGGDETAYIPAFAIGDPR